MYSTMWFSSILRRYNKYIHFRHSKPLCRLCNPCCQVCKGISPSALYIKCRLKISVFLHYVSLSHHECFSIMYLYQLFVFLHHVSSPIICLSPSCVYTHRVSFPIMHLSSSCVFLHYAILLQRPNILTHTLPSFKSWLPVLLNIKCWFQGWIFPTSSVAFFHDAFLSKQQFHLLEIVPVGITFPAIQNTLTGDPGRKNKKILSQFQRKWPSISQSTLF